MDSDAINQLTSIFDNHISTNLQNPFDGIVAIRDKIFTLLCSPMRDDFAHETYKWVSQLTLMTGDFSWICSDNRWTEQKEIKMFLCVARLSLIEIELLIPLLERHISIGSEPEMEDGKVVARSANSLDYDKFGNHLVIIENLIKVLVKDDKVGVGDCEESCTNALTTNMKDDDLGSLLDHLRKILLMILNYLEHAHHKWRDIDKRREKEQFAAIVSCCRIGAIWLADDPCGFIEQTRRFLIDLFVTILLDEEQENIDIFIVALHSMCTEETLIKPIQAHPRLQEALQKYLNFVSSEHSQLSRSLQHRKRQTKTYKLRCGMVRDILEVLNQKK